MRKQLYAIKPFYKWAWRQQIVDADTWMRIKDVAPPRGSTSRELPRPYRVRDVQRFWDELDAAFPTVNERFVSRFDRGVSRYRRIWTHAMHLQVQAVASLALFGGLRAQEIRYAEIDDIHPDNAYIVVRNGKGGRGGRQGYREVPGTDEGTAHARVVRPTETYAKDVHQSRFPMLVFELAHKNRSELRAGRQSHTTLTRSVT